MDKMINYLSLNLELLRGNKAELAKIIFSGTMHIKYIKIVSNN